MKHHWKILSLILLLFVVLSVGCLDSSQSDTLPEEEERTPLPSITTLSSVPTGSSPIHSSIPREKLENVSTYSNSYLPYTDSDLQKLKKFDIVMVEPYEMPASYVAELKKAGTVVIAYISIGEADESRRYWRSWTPTERATEIPLIPRTTVSEQDSLFIGPDPEWPGSFFVDARNETWQNIILNEEIPYILALGGDQYDGIVMDVIDVVDEYEGLPEEEKMRGGHDLSYPEDPREIPAPHRDSQPWIQHRGRDGALHRWVQV
ncbi:MAG: endo alpha-1,4 polygalactosaminidase [Methanoregulaceae archaeon]|nr:endo alpha-1,4 polygalactosaminidase [Methanoregulaceae archaeon]